MDVNASILDLKSTLADNYAQDYFSPNILFLIIMEPHQQHVLFPKRKTLTFRFFVAETKQKLLNLI